MKTINKTASKILDRLTAGLEVGDARKIAKSESFMPVHIERLSERLYSVAHYFEQNGDLMSDPRMEFWRAETGAWIPTYIEMHATGYTRTAVELEDDKPVRFAPRQLADQVSFTHDWMRNIKDQQGL